MPNPKYFVKSKRLGFRHWTQEDLQLAIELWGNYEVTKFFDKRGRLSNQQVNERLLKEMSRHPDYQEGVSAWMEKRPPKWRGEG